MRKESKQNAVLTRVGWLKNWIYTVHNNPIYSCNTQNGKVGYSETTRLICHGCKRKIVSIKAFVVFGLNLIMHIHDIIISLFVITD